MPRIKLPYREGDGMVVPLGQGEHALGIIARHYRGCVLAYCYRAPHAGPFTWSDFESLDPRQAALIRQHGVLGFLYGDWQVVPRTTPWDRDRWPIPVFRYEQDLLHRGKRWVLRTYDEHFNMTSQTATTAEQVEGLPDDGCSGYVAFEIRLCQTFGLPLVPGELDERAVYLGLPPRDVNQRFEIAKETSEKEPQAVLIRLEFASIDSDAVGRDSEVFDLATLEDALQSAMDDADLTAEVDGNEVGPEDATLFLYGSDANAMFRVVKPVLLRHALSQQARVEIRRGGPGAKSRIVLLQPRSTKRKRK